MDTLASVAEHLKAEIAIFDADMAAMAARKAAHQNLLGEVETAIDKAATPSLDDVKALLDRVVAAKGA